MRSPRRRVCKKMVFTFIDARESSIQSSSLCCFSMSPFVSTLVVGQSRFFIVVSHTPLYSYFCGKLLCAEIKRETREKSTANSFFSIGIIKNITNVMFFSPFISVIPNYFLYFCTFLGSRSKH